MSVGILDGNAFKVFMLSMVTGTVTTVAQGTSAERDFTVTGLAVGDMVFVNKPTLQAGLSIGNVRVKSANTLSITYVNTPNAGGNIQPTNETYTLLVLRPESTTVPTAVVA